MTERIRRQNDLQAVLLQHRRDYAPGAELIGEQVEFHALMPRAKVTGRYYIFGDRLSDALNREESFALTDVRTLDLESGTERFQPYTVVRRPVLLLVVASGPRGNSRRRFRTSPHPVTLHIGPYKISATVHMPPGGSPIPGIYRRQVMVPVTDVTIEYPLLGRQIVETYDAVIVNRNAIVSVVRTTDIIPAQLRPGAPRIDEGADEAEPQRPVFQPGPSTPPYLPRPTQRR